MQQGGSTSLTAIPEESLLSFTFIPQAKTDRQTEAAAWEALLLSPECEDLLGVGESSSVLKEQELPFISQELEDRAL